MGAEEMPPFESLSDRAVRMCYRAILATATKQADTDIKANATNHAEATTEQFPYIFLLSRRELPQIPVALLQSTQRQWC